MEAMDTTKNTQSSTPRWKQMGKEEKTAAVHEEMKRINQLPATSTYATHRLRVLNKILQLMSIKRTVSQDEELELLFAGLHLLQTSSQNVNLQGVTDMVRPYFHSLLGVQFQFYVAPRQLILFGNGYLSELPFEHESWLVDSWYHQLLGGDSNAQFLYNGMPLVSSATTASYTTIVKCAVIYMGGVAKSPPSTSL
ncbi:hypothetical protein D5086_003508 [Populus alba]|uniref:Uncharacterized protein n=1 Tax=Populus alba TaxID=43335 RepID=A0ACC4D4I5_POPAL